MRRWALLVPILAACGDSGTATDGGPDGQTLPMDGGAADGQTSPDAGPPPPPPGRCPALPASQGPVTMVTPAQAAMLPQIVQSAPSGAVLLLADGTYPLPATLQLSKPGVTLRGASNDATKVFLDAQYTVSEAIAISASNVTVAHVTVKRAIDHPIHAYPLAAAPVTGVRLYGLHIEDGGEQFVKVNSTDQTNWVDDSSIECSTFLLTPTGRTKVEPNPGGCYTGGIDVHGGRNWVVRSNRFEGIYCEGTGLAEHAIHFWVGSRDTLVENNLVIDCARGIGLGLGSGGGRTYPDDPFPGVTPIGHFGGTVRNNVIWAKTRWYDTGIELNQARGTVVVHNTVVHDLPMPNGFFSSIDYRFANTQVEIANNLVQRITVRDGAQGTLTTNLEMAPLSLFVGAQALDFHLAPSAAAAIDKGTPHAKAGADLDGEPHTKGAPDLGADER